MAIPSIPQGFYVQTANGQNLVSWDFSTGATSYIVQRSTDGGLTYSTVSTQTSNQYLDTTVTLGDQYFYQVAASNGSGTSPYTTAQSVVPTTSGEMSLGAIRLAAQQRADRVNSNFVTLPEWNSYINQAMFELYDLLITTYEDYFTLPPALFTTNGSTYLYPLPDGVTSFTDINGNSYVPPPFYKLVGVDLGINSANNAFVTVNKFNFADRNKFVYPNTASTIYGVFNLQYRLIGNKIEFIPTPSANQPIRLWYIPRLTQLLADTDVTDIGISGWIEYVIVKAAYYALTKEESDTTSLVMQLQALIERIQDSAVNRDAGMPDKISEVRNNGLWGPNTGWNGPMGGWAMALVPSLTTHNMGNTLLVNSIFSSQLSLTNAALLIAGAYFLNLSVRKFSSGVTFARIGDLCARSVTSFCNHVSMVIGRRPEEKVVGPDTEGVIASVANVQPRSIFSRVSQFIRNTMGFIPFRANGKAAISSSGNGTSPDPAFVSLINISPKSSLQAHTCSGYHAEGGKSSAS